MTSKKQTKKGHRNRKASVRAAVGLMDFVDTFLRQVSRTLRLGGRNQIHRKASFKNLVSSLSRLFTPHCCVYPGYWSIGTV